VALLARPHLASPEAEQRVTVSVGVACLAAGEPGASLARLMAAADAALYDAKARGRNQVAVSGIQATPLNLEASA
jgi:diguanylate cyclase (GGDEF)-like protein